VCCRSTSNCPKQSILWIIQISFCLQKEKTEYRFSNYLRIDKKIRLILFLVTVKWTNFNLCPWKKKSYNLLTTYVSLVRPLGRNRWHQIIPMWQLANATCVSPRIWIVFILRALKEIFWWESHDDKANE